MITKFVRKQIKEMDEINWGDIPDNTGMRLLWGENQEVIKIYKKAMLKEINKVNLYPSPTKNKLKEVLAKYNNVLPENIIPTNGSDDALELIAKVFITAGDEVVMPIPSYPCFASVSQMMGAKIVAVFLEKDFSLDIYKLIKAVTSKTKIVWIANPNNPTGNLLFNKKQIKFLARKINCMLVIDECYFEFSKVTASQLTKKYKNIIVVRSFSKAFSLAGVRLGYLICNQDAAIYLNRLQQTNQVFNVNRFAQTAGIALLENYKEVVSSIKKFEELKVIFEEKLKQILTLDIFPTKTTFCFIKINSKITGKQLKEKLGNENIFIKDCSIYQNLGSQYVYLGVPQKKYQTYVIKAIKNALLNLKNIC